MKLWPWSKKEAVIKQPLLTSEQLLELGATVNNVHTPDLWRLRMLKGHLVFVADELMRGRRCHSLISSEKKQEPVIAYTGHRFSMFKTKHGKRQYPVILGQDAVKLPGSPFRVADTALVKGEVYILDTEQLCALDIWKENGLAFRRERVFLDIPYREVTQERRLVTTTKGSMTVKQESAYNVLGYWQHYRHQDAWMYIGITDHFRYDPDLTPIRPVVPADPNLKAFFSYSEPIK